ncbi:MAG: TSUP family transporter [Campylobacteraceae bacterium]
MELELIHYVILFGVSLLAGFVDSIAGGGGIIAIPALLALGIPPHLALGTNKLGGSFGSFTAAYNFYKKGLLKLNEVWLGVVFTFIGAVIGTTTVLFIDATILKKAIPFMLVFLFFYFLFLPKLGEVDREKRVSKKVFYICFGLLLGFYDGFFGPGTGTFWMVAIVVLLGLNLKSATAQTKAMNFTSNIVSLGVFVFNGQVLFLLGIVMGIGQVLGAIIGSNMVVKRDVKFIRVMFLCVVGATILKLFYDNFMH